MSRMSLQAAVTMRQLQNKLDLIGHNLANSNTTGYKSQQADFSSLLFQQINNLTDPANAENRQTPDGIRIGTGAKLAHTNVNQALGAVQTTGRGLDVALLQPSNYFQVSVTENGVTETQFTRSGNFYLSPQENGQVMLATSDGNPVIGENGPILLEDNFDAISITNDGSIQVTRNGNQQVEAQLAIVDAIRQRVLEAAGENNFRLPDVEELGLNANEIIQQIDPGQVELKAGALEGSNVDLSKEMTELLLTQRAYQLNARSISMNDQMSGLINQLR